MNTHSLYIFEVERSYYVKFDGDVLGSNSITITDDDNQLDQKMSTDSGGNQEISIDGEADVTRYRIQYLDFAQVNNAGTEYELYAMKVEFADGDTKYYVLSKDEGFNPAVGDELSVTEYSTFTSTSYMELEEVAICFTPGTMITTPDGPRAAETLRTGDLVTTVDHGPQRLGWVGRTRHSPDVLALHPKRAPIRIPAGAFGNARDLLVSPQHRMLCHDGAPATHKLRPQTLISARHAQKFLNVGTVEFPAEGVEYIHLLFDRHELVIAEGAQCESLYLGPISWNGMSSRQKNSIYRAQTGTTGRYVDQQTMDPVRPFLTGAQIRACLREAARTEAYCAPANA